jgi:hypothetical protein
VALAGAPIIALEQLVPDGQVLDLVELEAEQLPVLSQLGHPVTAYLNGLALSSRRPQLAALEAIARRSTQVYSAETMPWQQLRRPHVLQIRSLLEENYRPSSANRMLAALRGVLRECWHAGLISTDDYQAAISVKAVRGESELRGRDLSAGELRSLFEACARAPQEVGHQQDSGARRRRDAAFLAIAYAAGVRRAEATSPAGSSGCARARARSPARRLWPPPLSPPSRTGFRSGAASRARSSVPCSRPDVWSGRAPEACAG